ncbi:TrkA-related ion transporter [Treponema sp.]|uniref:TrkA-related ion transporter n=1 Tax=Treponema sp. TaxID=166 RepID=UPI00298D930F|nr:NAD-binding protein [Treponema sp.]MCQ2241264.1 NAD-binding protein [Treponema sp.]
MNKKKKKNAPVIKRAFRFVLRNPVVLGYIALVIFIYCALAVVYTFETQTGSGIATKMDTFWFMCVAVCAGYFEFVCESIPGRAAAISLLIVGTMVFGYIRGQVASMFVDMAEKKNKGLGKLKNLEGHFIICGWRNGFEKILDTVMASNPDITPDMIVLVNEAPEHIEALKSDDRFKEINYVAGDFTDESTLRRAHIESAARALVICDHSKKYSNLEVDSRTVLAVLTIENMSRGIYVVAELLSGKFEKHLRMAHCDEIILTQDYERSLLATASNGVGYSSVISSFISDDASSGILIYDIEKDFTGTTFGELKKYETEKHGDRGVLVGILLNSGNFHIRRQEALREAQKNPNMTTIISNLQKVKNLKSNEPVLAPSADFVVPKHSKAIFVRGK